MVSKNLGMNIATSEIYLLWFNMDNMQNCMLDDMLNCMLK